MAALLVFTIATLAGNKLLDTKGPFGVTIFNNPARYNNF